MPKGYEDPYKVYGPDCARAFDILEPNIRRHSASFSKLITLKDLVNRRGEKFDMVFRLREHVLKDRFDHEVPGAEQVSPGKWEVRTVFWSLVPTYSPKPCFRVLIGPEPGQAWWGPAVFGKQRMVNGKPRLDGMIKHVAAIHRRKLRKIEKWEAERK